MLEYLSAYDELVDAYGCQFGENSSEVSTPPFTAAA